MPTDRQKFIWAIRQLESAGSSPTAKPNYQAVNPNSGALGAYQVMPYHLSGGGEWAGRTFGRSVGKAEFLASRSMQDRIADKILGGYYDTYGVAGAAAMWFSGQSNPNLNRSDGNMNIPQYVRTIKSLMAHPNAGTDITGGGGVADAQQVGGVIDGLRQMGEFFAMLTQPETWIRVGIFAAGSVLLVIALARMSGQVDRVASAVDKVTDYLPQTRALKAAVK